MPLKERIRSGIPLTLVISLGLAWTWVTWSDYSGQIVQPGGVATELVLRYYDRGLRVSEAGKRGNAYERWMAGTDTKKEWLEESRGTIRNLYLADLGEPGEGILDAIALRLGEPVTPPVGSDDPGYRRKMKDFLLAGHGQAWQFELFLHTKNDPEILAKYRSENDRLLARAMWTGSLDNAMLLFSSVVAAPVFEEIAFRGVLFQGLKSKTGVLWAAVISSVLFAVAHTQYDFWGWISVGMMGFIACYLTHRTGSLKTAIAFHAIGNLLISLDVYLFYQLPL